MTDLEITKAILTSAEQSARDGERAILVDTTTVISLLKASIRLDRLTGERMRAKLGAYFADTIAADHDVDDYMAEQVFEMILAAAASEQSEDAPHAG